jgi:hypothetical protein
MDKSNSKATSKVITVEPVDDQFTRTVLDIKPLKKKQGSHNHGSTQAVLQGRSKIYRRLNRGQSTLGKHQEAPSFLESRKALVQQTMDDLEEFTQEMPSH